MQKPSVIYALNFWTKSLCLSLILPLATFTSSIKALPLLVVVFIMTTTLSRINLQKFWKTTRTYIIPIIAGMVTLSLLFSAGTTQEKLIGGLILALRFSLLIGFGVLFSIVTNPIEIPTGFMQVGIPHRYGVTLMVAYRMMPLLSKKIKTITNAQRSRGASFKFSFKKPSRFFYQAGSLIVPLLHATLDMSVKLSDALISRGYNPEGKITVPPTKSSIYDFCLLGTSIGIAALGILL